MKVIILSLFLVFSSIPLPSEGASLSDLVKKNRRSIIYIRVEKADETTGAVTEQHGTGFVINQDGYVLTAAHIVRGGDGFKVSVRGATGSSEGPLEVMEVLDANSSFDAAVLRFKNTFLQRSPVLLGNPWKVAEDATIYAMGFPGIEEWFHTEGKLSGKGGPNGSWNTTITLNPGMSGGPIFDARGKVVALVWGGVPTQGIEGINRVLPINLLSGLLRIAGVNIASKSHLDFDKPSDNFAQIQNVLGESHSSKIAYEARLPISVATVSAVREDEVQIVGGESNSSEIDYKSRLLNQVGTVSEDRRVDERIGSIKIGCHGDTLNATVTITGVDVQTKSASNFAATVTYSGKYSRQGWMTPCVKSPSLSGREDLNLRGQATVTVTHESFKAPLITFNKFQSLGENTNLDHDSNRMARRALESAVRGVFYNLVSP